MKVVFPLFSIDICGGHKVFADVANGLNRDGHQVEVVMPYSGRISYPLTADVKRVPELARDTIPYGDVVLSNYFTTCSISYQAWPSQVVNLSQGFEPLWIRDPAVFDQYRYDVPIISTSRWLDNQIFKLTGRRTTVVNPGVNLTNFHPHPERTSPTIKRKVRKIMYVARHPSILHKGLHDFIEAMRIVYRYTAKDVVVLFTSPDAHIYYPSDIRHASYAAKSEREMASLYNEADIFVSTAWHEGFGLPPLEAMACGTPVVTTNSGGINEYCQHGYNSLIGDAKNPQSIARAILTLLDDPSLAQTLSRHGVETALNFSTGKFQRRFNEALLTIHNEILAT